MSLIEHYNLGSASADRYSTIDELLIQLPDNNANLITAQDIRDSVYSLWKNIEDVSIVASSAASAASFSAFFQNTNLTTITVGGIPSGSSFSTPKTMQEMWDLLLYPYVAPGAYLAPIPNREYGSSLTVNLSWSVVKNSNNITSIIVDGFPQTPTGNSQSGIQVTTGTHSVSPGVSETNIFNMSVSDGISITNASTTLTWMNRRYWGSVDLSSIGNPDLTINPGLSSLVAAFVTDAVILSLNGANANSQAFGSELSTTKNKTYIGINGSGKHLVFAWPSSVSNPYTPIFTVNGITSTAFTRIRTNSPFVNQYGFTTNYEVWISNTLQNSSLNIVIS